MERDPSSTTTRRRLLGTAAAATGAVIATAALAREAVAATVGPTANTVSPVRPAATPGIYGLELAGVQQGTLRSADGGDTYADVIVEPAGGKHLGPPKLDDFTVAFGLSGLSASFYEFVVNLMSWRLVETTGKLLSGDFNRSVIAARAFTGPRFSELAIPALDAGSKDVGSLALSFNAGSATDATPAGTIQSQATTTNSRWLVANFRLEIDDAPGGAHVDCTRVSKIDAITITDNGTRLEFPNLVVTFGAASLPGWKAWFNDFVVSGNNGQANERSGRITMLGLNQTTVLGVLELHNIGISKLDPDGEANPGGPARAVAELYVESMNFTQLGTWFLT